MAMFVVCGEALMDVYMGEWTSTGLTLDARVGGSPFNVAQGLARLERPVAFLTGLSTDASGERLLASLRAEGVDTSLVLRGDAPSTLSVVSVDAAGVPRDAGPAGRHARAAVRLLRARGGAGRQRPACAGGARARAAADRL
jgi:fructokinase